MITTIQCVAERYDYIKPVADYLDAQIYLDTERKGCLNSFIKMLDIPVKDYRLHLQDDIILARNFKEYLPHLQSRMEQHKWHCLSLFVPQRVQFRNARMGEHRISPYKDFIWLQATIFSRQFVERMREFVPQCKPVKFDDNFVAECLKAYKVKAWIHFPSIVQHNIAIHSTIGNEESDKRASRLYDPDLIINKYPNL